MDGISTKKTILISVRFTASVFAALLLVSVFSLTLPVFADPDSGSLSGRYEAQISARELQSLAQYLNAHRETAQSFCQDPELLWDSRFVRKQELFQDWLEVHPHAAAALQAHPRRYFARSSSALCDQTHARRTRLRERTRRRVSRTRAELRQESLTEAPSHP